MSENDEFFDDSENETDDNVHEILPETTKRISRVRKSNIVVKDDEKVKTEDEKDSEDTSNIIYELSKLLGEERLRARLYRMNKYGGNSGQYITEIPISTLLECPDDAIKDIAGGGDYEIRLWKRLPDTDRWKQDRRLKVSIAGEPKVNKTDNAVIIGEKSTEIVDSLHKLHAAEMEQNANIIDKRIDAIKENNAATVQVIKESMKSAIDNQSNSFTQVMTMMQASNAQTIAMLENSRKESLDNMRMMFELSSKVSNSGNGIVARSPLVDLIEVATPLITAYMTMNQATNGIFSKIISAIGPQIKQILADNGNEILAGITDKVIGGNILSSLISNPKIENVQPVKQNNQNIQQTKQIENKPIEKPKPLRAGNGK